MVAILVMATFIILLAVDYLIRRSTSKRETGPQKALRGPDRFLIPRGYFFGPKHSWIEVLWNGRARVGIDDFIQKIIGSVEKVVVIPVNSIVRKGEPLVSLTQGGRTVSVTAPISGKVQEVNERAVNCPEILNVDPYVQGWLALIEPEDLSKDIKGFTIADEAAHWLRKETVRFRDFIKAHTSQVALAGTTMLDGGIPVSASLRDADAEVWRAFEQEFLSDS